MWWCLDKVREVGVRKRSEGVVRAEFPDGGGRFGQREARLLRARLWLRRKLSPFISRMCTWWVRRSSFGRRTCAVRRYPGGTENRTSSARSRWGRHLLWLKYLCFSRLEEWMSNLPLRTSHNDARLPAPARIPALRPTIPARACCGGNSAPQHRRAKREARTATTLRVLTPVN